MDEIQIDERGQIIRGSGAAESKVEPRTEIVKEVRTLFEGLNQTTENGGVNNNSDMMAIFAEKLFQLREEKSATSGEVGQAFLEFQIGKKQVVGLTGRMPTESEEYELGTES